MPHDDPARNRFELFHEQMAIEPLLVPIQPGPQELRPVSASFPAVSASRGGIQFVRRTPAEIALDRLREQREARVRARRRRWARPLHRLARPILWLAYRVGPPCDRPVIEPEAWWD